MTHIQELIRQMTLEEKASLLSGADFWHTRSIERLGIRGIMVSDGPHGLRKQAQGGDHLGVNESIVANAFPAACATAASFDRDLVRQVGEAIGEECQHEEVAVNLGPAINIKRSPLCGRNFEYMSEDPFLAGEMAVSLIQGTQSKNVGVSVKHFAGNNQEHRRMSSDSVVDERTLREIYLPAFEAAAKRGKAWTFMCSYNRLNGEYASQNRWLLTDLLRGEWGFDGYVVSDWGAVSQRPLGVAAGLDLEMPGSGGINDAQVVQAVRKGKLDEKDVDRCVERILTVHQRYLDHARPDTPWDKDAHHELSGRLAADCMVLLKNEKNLLPLRKGEKVAIIGEFAARPRYQGGGSSHINAYRETSLLEAVSGNPDITYAQGYEILSDEDRENLLAEAADAARQADKVIIVAGLPDSYESEGYDRTHMRIPANQNHLIETVAAANPRTAVLLYNGAPVEMPWADRVQAILEGYLGGENVGEANRLVLWGEVNPSGRLPETFPMRLQDTPCYLNYGGEGNTAVYSEGIFVGYRYYSRKEIPVRYPFGHGLSYTSFAYSRLTLSADRIRDRDTLKVTVDVTNTGLTAGREVVQLYVAPAPCEFFRPVRELKGFEKISLNPGETKTVSFTLDERSFACWDVRIHDWRAETGSYGVQICRNAEEVILEAPVQVECTRPVPVTYTEDSIIMDIMKNPKAAEAVMEVAQAAVGGMTGGGEAGEVSSSAISAEMVEAMMRYMPLRSLISFSDGQLSHETLAKILEKMNG